jgi:regulator of protease activity HflC (stomatin/prohibitin superfamily)
MKTGGRKMFLKLFLSNGDIIAVAFIIIALITVLVIASSVRIIPQANAYVIEKLGSYYTT